MKVRDNSGSFENAPTGTHIARCVGLIGIGTHESEYNGQTRMRNTIIATWELPHELMSDGRPFTISQWYTRSLSDKANLRQDLVNWRGRDFTSQELNEFDLRNVLDKGCQVVVSENDKGRVKVTGIAGLPKGIELPERVNDLRYFDIEEFDESEFEKLSERMQAMVKESVEYQEIAFHGRILDPIERRNLAQKAEKESEQQFSGPRSQAATASTGGFNPAKDQKELDDIPF
jgi:hypothetical protein